MQLAHFIRGNIEPILMEWETFARSLAPGKSMTKLALRDDVEMILRATVRDMVAAQSDSQQSSKSKGHGGAGGEASDGLDDASTLHGVGRIGSGFDIMQVVAEYRSLRAIVLRLWRESLTRPNTDDIADITRFNESIDQSLAIAVGSYTRRVDKSRRMFLAILSHDLRDPLSCIRMAARLGLQAEDPRSESAKTLSDIETYTKEISTLINDMIDFASTGPGSELWVTLKPADLETLCRSVLEAFHATHPQRTIRFRPEGNLAGQWDAVRLQQVVFNLVANALQHGSADGPVDLSVAAEDEDVVLSVSNDGAPIPPEMLATLFDPLVRYATTEFPTRRVPGSIGLGLYIVREIVLAHAGTIDIASTARDGTTFTVRLPRQPRVDGDAHRDPKTAL